MQEHSKIPFSYLETLEEPDRERAEQILQDSIKTLNRKIVVLDDDPTGVQTVHDVSVYTDWEEESIRKGFNEGTPMFFILTNSRSFSAEETRQVHQIIAERVCRISQETGKDFLLVSRGDSTLRGHFPLETETLRTGLEKALGRPVDGEIICPFFPEGGRYTFGNVHYVKEEGMLIPAGMTEFARDKSFGYQASDLCEYVEEKTKGRCRKETCICITLEQLRNFEIGQIYKMLIEAQNFTRIIVNAVTYEDLKVFCGVFAEAVKTGKIFLARTAAAFPKVLAGVTDQPLLTRANLVENEEKMGGIVLIGSHVKKTTQQLEYLRKSEKDLYFLEFDVNTYYRDGGLLNEVERIILEAENLVKAGKTVVVYTSRKLLVPDSEDKEQILEASVKISEAVTSIIGHFSIKPRFIIAKGGITSSDVGTKALKVRCARVMGQIKKGIPIWMTGEESKFPGMPYIIFPGNVGEIQTLREIVEELM